MTYNNLTHPDYERLAQILAGPHGEKVTAQNPIDLLVVFSCADPVVGQAAAQLYAEQLIRLVVFSGGIGKDSGGLVTLGITEATFLAAVAIAYGMPVEVISLEREATNGKENAEFSLRLAAEKGLLLPGSRIASIAPVERSRRLFEELRYRAAADHPEIVTVAGFASGSIDVGNSSARAELVGELRGLHTMHAGKIPRIFPQTEFQVGGEAYDLVTKAGLVR